MATPDVNIVKILGQDFIPCAPDGEVPVADVDSIPHRDFPQVLHLLSDLDLLIPASEAIRRDLWHRSATISGIVLQTGRPTDIRLEERGVMKRIHDRRTGSPTYPYSIFDKGQTA